MTTAFALLQFLPAQIHVFETLPSTNDYLKVALLKPNEMPEGTLIWALQQVQGRGQQSNVWHSEAGKNITLSILLKPNALQATEVFRLSKVIALAVHSTVSHFVKNDVAIKWPNDIFVGPNKIAGILIENTIQGDQVKNSIVGIGLNVNQTLFSNDNNPTSLLNATGNNYSLQEVVDVLLMNISYQYLQLQLKNYEEIDRNYFLSLYQVHLPQTFIIHNEPKLGSIEGVLPDGSIILMIDEEKKSYLYGDARWRI